MKKLSFILFAICVTFASCSNDDSNIQEKDAQELEKMHQEIITLSLVNSEPCTDSKNWDFTALGTKSCGGVATFIVYSKKIDKNAFIAKVKAYTDAKTAFDKKYNISSTCEIILPPSSIECMDGKPKLIYGR
ncbi:MULTISPECIES: hypothetical protein [Flavobacterium]|uniref:Lipoprotein n=1 Tax=Flavobacterium aquidurense TaxID=362413 RepID=A0A0Q0RMZ5_9FLAO|nr:MULTISPECIES: hypothetical protein [Flavobacterium]KQB37413.1 hypothetical protein RC62_2579 [Flavobacterium aquidurense]OMQ13467.1 hypothetical protein BXU01_03035 [[Flexibacter] sp. ATCC 35103]